MLAEPPEITPKCLRAVLSPGPPETLVETARGCQGAPLELGFVSSNWRKRENLLLGLCMKTLCISPKKATI